MQICTLISYLFFINPPYGRASGQNKFGSIAKNERTNMVAQNMKKEKYGNASSQLYAQFLYKISKFQEINKNIKVAVFAKSLYKTGGSYNKFRAKFYNLFQYKRGFLFNAKHFSDTADNWGVDFSIWTEGKERKNSHLIDTIDIDAENFTTKKLNEKLIYNTDGEKTLSDWINDSCENSKTKEFPKLTSYLTVKESKYGAELKENTFATLVSNANNVAKNAQSVYIVNGGICENVGKYFITKENLEKCVIGFTARKSVHGNWINDKDEYLAPDESHPLWQQFVNDSLIYSLFNNSSQQSSLRQVDYKGKLWDIKNEFFWLSCDELLSLAEEHRFDDLYRDAKSGQDRFVYTTFQKFGTFGKLSDDARVVLDFASDLLRRSFSVRQLFSDAHPEYHLSSFDAGYAQLKLLWKEYFKDDFLEFRSLYKAFEDRLRPLVYELGFLK